MITAQMKTTICQADRSLPNDASARATTTAPMITSTAARGPSV